MFKNKDKKINKTLDLNFVIKDLNGKECMGFDINKKLIPITEKASKIIAGFLYKQNSGMNTIKISEICHKLYKNGKIEMDTQDLDLFEKEVRNIKTINNGLLYPILMAIRKAKDGEV